MAEETIAERLKRLRLEQGWSQRRLARVGYTAAYISRLEAGERQPSIRVLRRLADELGVDPHYLETGHEDPLLSALREIADGTAKEPQKLAARALKLHAEQIAAKQT